MTIITIDNFIGKKSKLNTKEIEINEFTNNQILKIGYNEFFYNDPVKNNLMGNYSCNIIIRNKYIVLYGSNLPVNEGIIIRYGSDRPLDFLEGLTDLYYLNSKIIDKIDITDNNELYKPILKLLQSFYKYFINEKISLDPITW